MHEAADSSEKGHPAGSIAAHGPVDSTATCDATLGAASTSDGLSSTAKDDDDDELINLDLLFAMEEPTLPKLPSGAADKTSSGEVESFFRKRSRPEQLLSEDGYPQLSSDQPFFSSDDDPKLENYTDHARKKKRSLGPYYDPDTTPKRRDTELKPEQSRILKRQDDSGLYSGSDGAFDSDVGDNHEASSSSHPSALHILAGNLPAAARPSRPLKKTDYETLVTVKKHEVKKHIDACIESGESSIDLTYDENPPKTSTSFIQTLTLHSRFLGLKTISNESIKALASFTPVTIMGRNQYEELLPELKIFLANNELESIPGGFFNLEHITVFSVRHNRIKEIPTAISRLSKIKELNVANNQLRWLPYEILELYPKATKDSQTSTVNFTGQRNIHFYPNPFFGARRAGDSSDIETGSGSQEPYTMKYEFRSRVRFFEKMGKLVQGPVFPTDDPERDADRNPKTMNSVHWQDNSIEIAPEDDIPMPPTKGPVNRVPSLIEVGLKNYAKLPLARRPTERALVKSRNQIVVPLVHHTLRVLESETKLPKCTICERTFVLARTEWLEWWSFDEKGDMAGYQYNAKPVPLMRRGCSWMCVPGAVLKGDDEDGDEDEDDDDTLKPYGGD